MMIVCSCDIEILFPKLLCKNTPKNRTPCEHYYYTKYNAKLLAYKSLLVLLRFIIIEVLLDYFFHGILDAVVGLSSNAYYISSTAEDVQVCVRVSSPSISCPITFPFDLFFNFTDETAGLLCYTVLYAQ